MKIDDGDVICTAVQHPDGSYVKSNFVIVDGKPVALISFGGIVIQADSKELVRLINELSDVYTALGEFEALQAKDAAEYKRLYEKFGGVAPTALEKP